MQHVVTVLDSLREHPLTSRAELAKRTGLSVATVSRAVAQLGRDGFVNERALPVQGIGRPPRMVRLRPDAAFVIGIDVGAAHVRGVLVDIGGSLKARASAPIPTGTDVHGLVRAVADLVGDLRLGISGRCLAAAAGLSGIVDRTSGRLLLCPDMPGLEGADLADLLTQALNLPVAVDNDDLLAAIGEATLGAARGCTDVVFLSLGYGLGAGIIVEGRPVRGADSAAGAIAYLTPGRLEQHASGRAIPTRYRELAHQGTASADQVDAEAVFVWARAGDQAATAVVDEVVNALAGAVVNVAALLDPQVIVLGGGLVGDGSTILEPLRARLSSAVPYPPRLVLSALGEDAVAQGAALRALSIAKRQLAAHYGSPSPQPNPERVGALQLG